MRSIAVLAVALGLASFAVPAGGQDFLRGDSDASGFQDFSDVTRILQYLFTEPEFVTTPLDRMDLNDNEIINLTDYHWLMGFLFLDGSPPLVPWLTPGPDPDDDLGTLGPVQPGFEVRISVEAISQFAVEIGIEVESPLPVRHMEVILELSSELLGDAAAFVPTPGIVLHDMGGTQWSPPHLLVFMGGLHEPLTLPPDGRIGTLVIPHDGPLLPCPSELDLAWVPEATVLGALRRATVADATLQDHHPAGVVDLCGSAVYRPWFRRGDCNGDDRIDIADGVSALAALFSGGAIPCDVACDANDDGAFDCADPVYQLLHTFAGGPAPGAPYPDCGPDATPDALICDAAPTCP